MTTPGTFTILARDGAARRASLATAHGVVQTPAFMPVGTQGSVKSLCPRDLREIGTQILLGNTYHLYLRPGDELIARLGGLHRFMAWDGPILTDSGGFQVFSLAGLRRLTPDGVEFASHIDGSKHFFSPEKVVSIQQNLGSDIMMVLDECVPYGADFEYTRKSLALTTAWAARCREAHPPLQNGQLLFGIVQGGFSPELRAESAAQITTLGFDGHALGGISVGEPRPEMHAVINSSAHLLPDHKPRYLMGVGAPQDILAGVAAGIDLFDCVLATRNARNGTLFTSTGKVNVKKAAFREDDSPLDPACSCYACRTFSRAYLRHLYIARELLSYRLNTIHNLTFFLSLTERIRRAIETGTFQALKAELDVIYPPDAPTGE